MTREQALKHPAYWFEQEQNELFRQVSDYMQREKITRTQLAKRLNVSKGYVSQILNGNYNYTLKKWIELCLAIGIVPAGYKRIDDIIKEDIEFCESKKKASKNKILNEVTWSSLIDSSNFAHHTTSPGMVEKKILETSSQRFSICETAIPFKQSEKYA